MNSNLSRTPNLPLVFWLIWGAILGGVIVIYFVLGKTTGTGPGSESLTLRYLPLVPFVASLFIRWFLLLRSTAFRQAIVLFVLGLAMAESCTFLGIFMLPEMKHIYFALSLVGIAQYAPFYASQLKR